MRSTQKLLLWTSIFLVSCVPSSIVVTPQPTLTKQTPSTLEVDLALSKTAEEFRTLRPLLGQFSGGKWQADIDQWQGKKHQLMLELGVRLADGTFDREQLISLLGPPDHTATDGDPLFSQIQTLPDYQQISPNGEIFVYEWRGTHDFLFFALAGEQIISSDWWYAGE